MDINTPLLLIAAVMMLGLLFVLLPVALHTYQRFRHRKVITCPDAHRLAEVTLKAGRAGFMATLGKKSLLRVKGCSLWPKKKGCAEQYVKENWPGT